MLDGELGMASILHKLSCFVMEDFKITDIYRRWMKNWRWELDELVEVGWPGRGGGLMIPIDLEQDTLHCLVLILERDKGEELTADKHKGRTPQSMAQISLTPLPIRIYGSNGQV